MINQGDGRTSVKSCRAYKLQVKNSRIGAAAVFLTMIFSSMLIVVSTLVNAGGHLAGKNIAEASTDIAGRSILAAYDKQLKNDYGIFAFEGEPAKMEKDLYSYIKSCIQSESDPSEDAIVNVLRLRTVRVAVDLKGYSLADLNLFKDQLTEQMKYRVLFKDLENSRKITEEMSTGLFLTELAYKIMAIIKDFNEMGEWCRLIKEAEQENRDSEVKLRTLLEEFKEAEGSSPPPDDRLFKIERICSCIRINDESILFNIDRIKSVSKEILDAIESTEEYCQSNIALDQDNAAAKMIDTARSIKKIFKHLENSYSDEWNEEMNNNIKLLLSIEKDPLFSLKSKDAFIEQYSWGMQATLAGQFDLEKIGDWQESTCEDELKKVDSEKVEDAKNGSCRILRNDQVLEQLPSHEFELGKTMGLKLPSLKECGDIKKLIETSIDLFLVDRYIMTYMSDHLAYFDEEKHFFRNEIEYILYGSFDDHENYDKFKSNFILLRTGLNIAHIFSDPVKRGQAQTLATGLTPGPWAGLTELAIITAWSEAEAVNDFKMIESGRNVCLIKQRCDWALSLESLLQNRAGQVFIPEGNTKGWKYENYLELFLLFEKQENKLLRTMDIIQINMQGRYNKRFYVKYRYCGFSYKVLLERASILPAFNKFWGRPIELEGDHAY